MPSIILSDNGVISGSAGLKETAASDGALVLQTTTAGGTATNAVYINNSQNVGLGVTPSAWSGSTAIQSRTASFWSLAGEPTFTSVGANYYYDGAIYRYISSAQSSDYYQFLGQHVWRTAPSGTAGNAISFTQAMTLDASGNLGVGTTSQNERLRLNSSTAGQARLSIAYADTPISYFGSYSGITGSGNATDVLLTSANVLAFGTGGTTERVRIDSSGNLLLGTTSLNALGSNILLNPANGTGYFDHSSAVGSGSAYLFFYWNNNVVGSVTQVGTTAVLYNTTSDQRLKENIADSASASSLIDAIQVRQYDWKSDGSHQRYGFVAQELVTVAPEAVHQPADSEEMMAVDYSKLVPMLVKEIQSLRARVASLESN